MACGILGNARRWGRLTKRTVLHDVPAAALAAGRGTLHGASPALALLGDSSQIPDGNRFGVEIEILVCSSKGLQEHEFVPLTSRSPCEQHSRYKAT